MENNDIIQKTTEEIKEYCNKNGLELCEFIDTTIMTEFIEFISNQKLSKNNNQKLSKNNNQKLSKNNNQKFYY